MDGAVFRAEPKVGQMVANVSVARQIVQ